MSTVSIDGAVTGSYIYNAWNQLIQKTAMGSTTHYIHDLDGNVLAEIDSSGQTQTEYIWMEYRSTKTASQATGATVPLAMISDIDTVTPKLSYIHTDHQNKQIILTDENRGTVRQVVSTPFGVLASTSGDVGLNTKAGFAGQWTLPEVGESGLAYNWHRHYDPSLGRYTQPDPLGLIDGPSRYAYAGNNPVRYEDPRGEAIPLLGLLASTGGSASASATAAYNALTGAVILLSGAFIYDNLFGDSLFENKKDPCDYGDDCDRKYDEDMRQCSSFLSLPRNKKRNKELYGACKSSAAQRYGECIQTGQSRSPLSPVPGQPGSL